MQITRGQLKQIIAEEVDRVASEKDEVETLVENYVLAYSEDADNEYVSKDSVIDFLEVIEEGKIPREAVEAFLEFMPEKVVTSVLKDVIE